MVKTRIAPSPTGFMHIGTLRTALTNFLFAQKNKGHFIIRLEDTDQNRLVEGSSEDLIKSLKWAGLSWDEGIDFSAAPTQSKEQPPAVIEKGDFGPYVQSKRLPLYQKYVQQLIDQGRAYYCFCTPERLEKMRTEQQKNGQPPRYDKTCLRLPQSKINELLKKKTPYVIRLRVPAEGTTEFKDLVRGKITIENKLIDDQVLMKSDGFPTYHLAVVIDDHLMEITHILRGEEWLPSTPKHILIYQAFGWKQPEFGHLPQLLNLNGKKLSKRDGDVAVRDFIKKGYPAAAIINYIALLGWNPKTTQEIFSLKELIEQFDVGKLNKAGAKFDYNRLDWFGSHYIKQMDDEAILKETAAIFKQKNVPAAKALKIIAIQKERIPKFSDILTDLDYLIEDKITYNPKMLPWKEQDSEETHKNLQKSWETLANIEEQEFSLEVIQEKLLAAAGDNRGSLLWPLRVALTGAEKSPSPFECAWVLGKEESLERIKKAIELLQKK